MSRTYAPPVRVARTKSNLKRDPIDHWVISYCVRGAHFTNTAGTSLEVPAKMPFLCSLGQEFLHDRTHIDRVQFLMARDDFQDIAPLLDAACGSVLDTPLGHLLGDYMMALERHLPAVTEADFPGLTNAIGAMVAAASLHRRSAWPSPNGKSISAARSGCGRPSAGTCERPPWGRKTSAGLSECPVPISIDCSKIRAAWPATFNASGCSKRGPSCPIPRRPNRSPQLPRTSALQMPLVSAGLSNESSATAPARCGRLHWSAWRSAQRHVSAYYQIERISARSSADSSNTAQFSRCHIFR